MRSLMLRLYLGAVFLVALVLATPRAHAGGCYVAAPVKVAVVAHPQAVAYGHAVSYATAQYGYPLVPGYGYLGGYAPVYGFTNHFIVEPVIVSPKEPKVEANVNVKVDNGVDSKLDRILAAVTDVQTRQQSLEQRVLALEQRAGGASPTPPAPPQTLPQTAPKPAAKAATPDKAQAAVVASCVECHAQDTAAKDGGSFVLFGRDIGDADIDKILKRLTNRSMPPKTAKHQPTGDEFETMVAFFEEQRRKGAK